jgi:hypothetical protein
MASVTAVWTLSVFQNDSPWLSILILGTSKITRWQIWSTRGLRKHGNVLLARNSQTDNAVCGRVVVTKLKWSNLLQFPFELASSSFSDGPRLQGNISDSLWHHVVHILYELTRDIRKKWWQFYWFFICSCELNFVLEAVARPIPHSASWFQGRTRKIKFRELLWPE